MATYQLTINQKPHSVEAMPDTPLLWVLRDMLDMTGTKYGCGKALCGACTVHIDGLPARSCSTPVSTLGNKSITTIEGVGQRRLHPVQKAWMEEDVPQCGYCQGGQIMSAIEIPSWPKTILGISIAMNKRLDESFIYLLLAELTYNLNRAPFVETN